MKTMAELEAYKGHHPVVKVLGFINCLPATLLSLVFYVGPLLIFRQIRPFRKASAVVAFGHKFAIFVPFEVIPGTKYSRWIRYSAETSGAFLLINKPKELLSRGKLQEKVLHEVAHVLQQCLLGIFMPMAYVLCSVLIWLWWLLRHSYYDNPFERHARRFARQVVDIPPEKWADGPNDRWIWW